jgi:hypothetical protein
MKRDLVAEQRHRDIIRTTQLIKRLQGYGLGEIDDQSGKPVDMSPAQVKAVIALLKKTVPDLQNIDGSLELHHHKHEEALKDLE